MKRHMCSQLKNISCPAQVAQLEHRPVPQEVWGLIPSQGTYLGWKFDT